MSWTAETNIKGPKGDTGGIGEAPTDGQTYGRKNSAWNVVVSGGGAASSITFTPAGNIAATNVQAAIAEVDTEKVAKAGDTMTGNLQINKANPSLVLQKTAAGQANQLAGYNGANPRWSLALGDSTTEAGSNAGSDFALYRYTDAGGLIDTPMTIARASGGVTLTGALTLPADPTAALQAATKRYVDNKPGGAIVSDTAPNPTTTPAGSLFWESDTGLLYVNYNDGDSTQWVMAMPLADATRYAVRFDTAQTLTTPQTLQAKQNIAAVGYDQAQTLTATQKAQARANIDVLKKNYILNSGMQISQENGTAAVTANGAYPVDQFFINIGTTGTPTAQQVVSPTAAGSPNRIRVTATVADAAVAAGDIVWLQQNVEGLRVADLRFGSASAKTVTVQFGVRAPAGIYSVIVVNSAANRSYVAEYVIAAGEANTDVVKSVVIPGDIVGTWLTDSGLGLTVRWGLMAGTTYQQAAGAWGTVNAFGSPNQFNFMGTAGNVFELFDVGLYEGNVAPAFQVPDYASELLLCQRHYVKRNCSIIGYGAAGALVGQWFMWPVQMRVAPTVTNSGGTYGNASGLSAGDEISPFGCRTYISATAAGTANLTSFLQVANART